MRSIDPATRIMLDQNLEEAFVDASSTNRKISVLPADDGEVLVDEVREITDDEAVEILESIDLSDDRQLRLQVNKNAEEIQALGSDITKIRARLFDDNGAKGHITQTATQFKEIKDDISAGFSSQNQMIKQLDDTIQHVIIEQNRCIKDHEARISALEKCEADRKTTWGWVKKALIGALVGNGGVIAAVFFWIKAKLIAG